MRIRLNILFALMIVLVSCTPEDITPTSSNYNGIRYFPLDSSVSITYRHTEITIDKPVNRYDTVEYYVRETIVESFIDETGNRAYVIEQQFSNDIGQNYFASSRYIAQVFNQAAFVVKDNIRTVIIRFPAQINKTWNLNAFNTLDQLIVSISSIDAPFTYDRFEFDSVLVITHKADSSLIHKNLEKEIFAAGIGLVYRENIQLNSQEVIPQVPVENRITTGTINKTAIVDYSINNSMQ